MPERDWVFFLKDIYKSTERIIEYTTGLTLNKFLADYKTYDAVMRNLEIIGEAAKHLPKEILKQYPHVEWKKISGLRDIVIHEYFGINEAVVWDVVSNKVPELRTEIKKILVDLNQK